MSAPTRFAGTTGHPVGETKTNLCVGMDKGKVVSKLEKKQKPSYRKGVRERPAICSGQKETSRRVCPY